MIANQALEEAFANIDKINEGTFKVRKLHLTPPLIYLGFNIDHVVAQRQFNFMEL